MTAVLLTAERDVVSEVVDAINSLNQDELDELGAWQPLSDLSSRTQFEAIDGDPDSVIVDAPGRFQAIATVYVMLVYGSSRDEEAMSDEYVATVQGRVLDNDVVIDTVKVDTTPFYE
ncbi:MAG TPA: hypothetical protein VF592_00510 [Sphingomonas sp.]|jgi:hypothetical protein|uniref:hypothetical protein n=1 Tax=Sphingomonas sp. TaxID=28214 RepID=UPI002ED7A215